MNKPTRNDAKAFEVLFLHFYFYFFYCAPGLELIYSPDDCAQCRQWKVTEFLNRCASSIYKRGLVCLFAWTPILHLLSSFDWFHFLLGCILVAYKPSPSYYLYHWIIRIILGILNWVIALSFWSTQMRFTHCSSYLILRNFP